MEEIGKMFNFTWTCDQEPNGDWGSVPISGPSNLNGTWGGVLGNIVNGDYAFTLSYWWNVESRLGMCDYILVGQGIKYIFTFLPQPLDYDATLFTRPFQNDVWIVISGISIILLMGLQIAEGKLGHKRHCRKSSSYRFIKSVAWLAFFLFSVYYQGALTMFFTTEITIPFTTLREAALSYPEWKLRFKPGDEGFLYVLASDGDKDANEFFNRIQNFPKEAQFKTVEGGIIKLLSEKSAIFLSENELRLYNKYYPIKENLKVLPGYWDVNGLKGKLNEIIVPYNSPLQPILSEGFQLLHESGMMTSLEARWVGRSITTQSIGMNTFVLKPGQVMFVFSMLSGAIIFSLFLFVIEYFTRYLLKIRIPYLV